MAKANQGQGKTWGDAASYGDGLVATAPVVSVVATLLLVGLYLAPWPGGLVVPAGPGSALIGAAALSVIAWLVAAIPMQRRATASNGDPSEYELLCSRLCELEARLGDATTNSAPTDEAGEIARAEAQRYRAEILQGLQGAGIPWVLSTGYNALWTLMHRLDETLFDINPTDLVIRDALYDEARLERSTIAERDELLVKLRMAVLHLCPSAAMYLDKQPMGPSFPPVAAAAAAAGAQGSSPPAPAPAPASGTSANHGPSSAAAPQLPADACSDARQARAALRDVRRIINEFRDAQWDGLVRMRNQLVATTGYTALFVFGVFALAILLGAPRRAIVAASAFFLVGSVVGLFHRLYIQSKQDSAIDDRGLADIRLLLAPMLSGIAAVGGVVITLMLYSSFIGPVVSAAPSTTAPVAAATASAAPLAPTIGGSSGGSSTVLAALPESRALVASPSQARQGRDLSQVTPLQTIFDLEKDPLGLAIAAVFGLTPGLLLSGLQEQTAQYKAHLKSSQATSPAQS